MKNLHYATCAAWSTTSELRALCDCPPENVWQIRRVGFRRYEVCRWLDGRWTRFMRTSSRDAAAQLVASLQWLTFEEGLRRVG